MLNDWFKKLQEELDALTEVDLKRVAINLGKPNQEDIFVMQLPEELQKLWTLIGYKEREVKKLHYEHSRDCKQDGSEDCKAFSKKCLVIIEDVDVLRKMFQMAFRRGLTEDQKKILDKRDVYISRDFKTYSRRREASGFPSSLINIMEMIGEGGILVEL